VRVSVRNYNDFESLFFAVINELIYQKTILLSIFYAVPIFFIVVHAEFVKVEIEFRGIQIPGKTAVNTTVPFAKCFVGAKQTL
jgi:hypothetical protein